jgi:uncharacterized damage-inducible protein DinB
MEIDHDRRRFVLLARYNALSNETLNGILAAMPREELTQPRGAYFGSILGTLGHLLSCDENWLRRFRELCGGGAPLDHPRLEPAGHVWRPAAFTGFDEFVAERQAVDGIFVEWAATVDTVLFDRTLDYSDSYGVRLRYVFRDAAEHVFNHQTHHRGQVSQLLDELGVKHDFSDLLNAAEIPSDV